MTKNHTDAKALKVARQLNNADNWKQLARWNGEGYYTLYAHLGAVGVSRGARVEGGSALGVSGDTGSLSGPALYFEVRKGEQALDPASWLARRPRARHD